MPCGLVDKASSSAIRSMAAAREQPQQTQVCLQWSARQKNSERSQDRWPDGSGQQDVMKSAKASQRMDRCMACPDKTSSLPSPTALGRTVSRVNARHSCWPVSGLTDEASRAFPDDAVSSGMKGGGSCMTTVRLPLRGQRWLDRSCADGSSSFPFNRSLRRGPRAPTRRSYRIGQALG